jgi:3'5'-cyclic nucleotide phosphodiesterase
MDLASILVGLGTVCAILSGFGVYSLMIFHKRTDNIIRAFDYVFGLKCAAQSGRSLGFDPEYDSDDSANDDDGYDSASDSGSNSTSSLDAGSTGSHSNSTNSQVETDLQKVLGPQLMSETDRDTTVVAVAAATRQFESAPTTTVARCATTVHQNANAQTSQSKPNSSASFRKRDNNNVPRNKIGSVVSQMRNRRLERMRKQNLATPIERMSLLIEDLIKIGEFRDWIIIYTADIPVLYAVGEVLLKCIPGAKNRSRRFYSSLSDLQKRLVFEEQCLLQDLFEIITTSRNFVIPDIRSEIQSGHIDVDDASTRAWLMRELGTMASQRTEMSMRSTSRKHLESMSNLGDAPHVWIGSEHYTSTRNSVHRLASSLFNRHQTLTEKLQFDPAAHGSMSLPNIPGTEQPDRNVTSESACAPRGRRSIAEINAEWNMQIPSHPTNTVAAAFTPQPPPISQSKQPGTGTSAYPSALRQRRRVTIVDVDTGISADTIDSDSHAFDNKRSPSSQSQPTATAATGAAVPLSLPSTLSATTMPYSSATRKSIFDPSVSSFISSRGTPNSTDNDTELGVSLRVHPTSVGCGLGIAHSELQASESNINKVLHRTVPDGDDISANFEEIILTKTVISSHGHTISLLQGIEKWNFDLFGIAHEYNHNPLPLVGYAILMKHDLIRRLRLDVQILQQWLVAISAGYHQHNQFHNAMHAADVAHTVSYCISNSGVGHLLSSYEQFACLTAAMCHDFDHPGVNNTYLSQTGHPLSVLYNDRSVLENHHAASALSLMDKHAHINVFSCVPSNHRKAVRSMFIDLILATDLAVNFAVIGEFKQRFASVSSTSAALLDKMKSKRNGAPGMASRQQSGLGSRIVSQNKNMTGSISASHNGRRSRKFSMVVPSTGLESDRDFEHKGLEPSIVAAGTRSESRSVSIAVADDALAQHKTNLEDTLEEEQNRLLLLKMFIKCSDLGHPAKSWKLHFQWTERITAEFFAQGDLEAKQGLEKSPFMDRAKHHELPKQQLGFFDFLVVPMWTTLLDICRTEKVMDTCRQKLHSNRAQWNRLHESGMYK